MMQTATAYWVTVARELKDTYIYVYNQQDAQNFCD